MKKFFVFLTFAAAALFAGCDSPTTGRKIASIGAPYEIIVICSQDKWDSALGDTLRYIMQEPVEGINQYEPSYDLLRVLPGQFSGMLQKNRNVLSIATGSDYDRPFMAATYDVYATPQIVVTITGPDNQSVTAYMSEHAQELRTVFEIAERNRDIFNYRRYNEDKIQAQIFEMFGFYINIPRGYKLRNTAEDFIWISMEYPAASQGVLIYSYPYEGREDFLVESLVEHRNEFVALIPGENPGSHMITYDGYVPDLVHKRINGRFWAEMRGFWDVKGDWMGGPFVSYSTLDVETQRVITVDFYLYSPDKNKRNFLRGLEHLIFTVNFPGDEN